MSKKISAWKTKGMNQDLSVSAFNPEFAYENINLRLSTNEHNTLMSWVNERGTKKLIVAINNEPYSDGHASILNDIQGTPIGTAVINHQLVVFTTSNNYDYIYVFEKHIPNDSSDTVDLDGKVLFKGNLNFSAENPLETLVSYEAQHIQKVYWVDGRNQPRVINIVDEETLAKWQDSSGTQEPYDTYFDFVPAVALNETIEIEKDVSAGGLFAPGVVQYAFTYINKHGQQSNIFYVSPLYYLALSDRGASPEEKVTCCFNIKMSNADPSFDYVRIYSLQRTSINLEPFVKLLADIPVSSISSDSPSTIYTDAGTTGSNVDPTELLFIGGKETIAYTMADKDQTLFLGNIEQKDSNVRDIQAEIDRQRGEFSEREHFVEFDRDDVNSNHKTLTLDHTTGIYSHTNMLDYNRREITTFKGGENYRFGFQLQKKTGEWSDPIYLEDITNDKYPYTEVYSDVIKLPFAKAEIDLSGNNLSQVDAEKLATELAKYKRIRPVIVYPNISDRKVLCQGVLNPTVFNARDRVDNSPFAQASWYFRPNMTDKGKQAENVQIDDNKRTITSESIEEEHAVTNDLTFGAENSKEVVVLVADIYEENIDHILQYGEIQCGKMYGLNPGELTSISNRSFIGAIYLQEFGTDTIDNVDKPWKRYAFIFEAADYFECNFVAGARARRVYQDNVELSGAACFINDTREDGRRILLYKGLSLSDKHILYYDTSTNHDYTLQFNVYDPDQYNDDDPPQQTYWGYLQKFYEVKFLHPESSSDGSYVPITGNASGNEVEYKHYACLLTDDAAGDDINRRKGVEIQGSINTYSSVYDTSAGRASIKSNTQFFVDQSIVTLNSPDIEFDTEVQVYGNEGLKLRVIGAIPITANVSSHSMLTSSAMLDSLHSNSNVTTHLFGYGESDYNVLHNNVDTKAGNRLVSDYLWNDVIVYHRNGEIKEGEDDFNTSSKNDFLIYPWHRSGSLNNDYRTADKASSLLSTKKESNLLFSINTEYFEPHDVDLSDERLYTFNNINEKIYLTENAEVINIRLPRQKSTSSEINYYPNIDKVLYNEDGYFPRVASEAFVDYTESSAGENRIPIVKVSTPVPMKYKSTSHAVISLKPHINGDNIIEPLKDIPILPLGIEEEPQTQENVSPNILPGRQINRNISLRSGESDDHVNNTFWGDYNMTFEQQNINIFNLFKDSNNDHWSHNYLWIGELYKEPANPFGGNTEDAIRQNVWLVGGDAVNLGEVSLSAIPLYWTEGDTYYERYDCLKTYAFTPDDRNQLVEILSFMCETHVNIDGRYDKNRGQADNRNMHPINFNLWNPVYSQQDNFFSGKISDVDKKDSLIYPNHIYYSKTKTSGADVDLWTNITLASTLELDGDKGEINALKRLNDQIVSFQDTGIAQILYNENVQISSTQGVPIEIANSGKVQGKRYLSDTVGCTNKWSMSTTPLGIYFMDSKEKSIYLFNGQLNLVSTTKGFNTWSKKNISAEDIWNPENFKGFVSYYDKQNQDVLFINDQTALAYSEKFGTFTSFYDYGSVPYYVTLDDVGIWIGKSKADSADDTAYLWSHQQGEYCTFFDKMYPYSMTLVGNPTPQLDKIFTNLEFRACVDGDGDENQNNFTPYLPFTSLEAWNEYQHGITVLSNLTGHSAMMHHTSNGISSLKRKFRIWRCDIPRDNAPTTNDAAMGITRFGAPKPMHRLRNPWIYIKLLKDVDSGVNRRTEIHDLLMTYFD